jgi:hypothetical protein
MEPSDQLHASTVLYLKRVLGTHKIRHSVDVSAHEMQDRRVRVKVGTDCASSTCHLEIGSTAVTCFRCTSEVKRCRTLSQVRLQAAKADLLHLLLKQTVETRRHML